MIVFLRFLHAFPSSFFLVCPSFVFVFLCFLVWFGFPGNSSGAISIIVCPAKHQKLPVEPAQLYFRIPVEPAKLIAFVPTEFAKLYFGLCRSCKTLFGDQKTVRKKPGQKTGQKSGQNFGQNSGHADHVLKTPLYRDA